MVITNMVSHWGMLWVVMVKWLSVGGDIGFDPMNRLNGRLLFAKVNQSGRITNAAFPETDDIKAIDLTWSHYLRPFVPIKINGWFSDY